MIPFFLHQPLMSGITLLLLERSKIMSWRGAWNYGVYFFKKNNLFDTIQGINWWVSIKYTFWDIFITEIWNYFFNIKFYNSDSDIYVIITYIIFVLVLFHIIFFMFSDFFGMFAIKFYYKYYLWIIGIILILLDLFFYWFHYIYLFIDEYRMLFLILFLHIFIIWYFIENDVYEDDDEEGQFNFIYKWINWVF